MHFTQMTTTDLVSHASKLPLMTDMELALLDRLQSALGKLDGADA